MKKKINVLHIASFIGNIGDNANHKGSKLLRDKFLDYEFIITRKEIRGFYWGEWIFNSDKFVEEANEYDLIMIGGGNYFELWVSESETGTSIDLGIKYMKRIKTPILFYSLGCDLGQGVPEENINKFKVFLDYLCSNKRYFVSVRNDGALANINFLYGQRYIDSISEIPDGGFFTAIENIEHIEIEKNKLNIVINVAGDMQDVRFSTQSGHISYKQFTKRFAHTIELVKEYYCDEINVIFVPHIFRDLKVIYDVINEMNDKFRRQYVKVAPYLVGDQGHDYIFSLYNQADLVLGMRFHSNVCGYALKKNVIGLVNYPQVKNLYSDISSDEYVEINTEGFETKLLSMILEHLSNQSKYVDVSQKIVEQLQVNARNEYTKLNQWLEANLEGEENE
ncbi:polysaccharide pyruvyl transferase family protein [Paenibacillus bouchesdurhonensis]|uniref:polysaccharide pyruvyl transferase family protein n=1 Tax=Paenibacillus bouchesdurhonensis TaxID=1870990 RepID=UPI0018FFDC8D|nr:polysaccharide pyruvyl transferase family protein [Paenibacillus bouchesdurhonensis]